MTEKNFNFNLPDGVNEVVVREGAAIKVLDPRPPLKIDIAGTIFAPFEFLEARSGFPKDVFTAFGEKAEYDANGYRLFEGMPMQLDLSRTHLLVDREKVTITLITNEHDEYTKGVVSGKLEIHPKFEAFGINSEKEWEPNRLGQFMKMNRFFFVSNEENMELVSKLKNFKANINAIVEKTKSDSGSFADNYSAAVDSNLPGSFKLKIPLFKGFKAEVIEVEFYASVNGRDFTIELVSPGAAQAFEEVRDSIIDAEIEKFRTLAPYIPIIEK